MSGMNCQSQLSEEEMGRIALKLLIRAMVKHKEVPDLNHRRRECPVIAKEIDENPEKLQEFFRSITPCIVGRIVGSRRVSMEKWIDTNGMNCQSQLSEEEMGRIALKLLIRAMAKKKEIPDLNHRRRECPVIAKEIGEELDDQQEFIKSIIPSVIGHIVGCRKVFMSDWVDTK